MKAAGATAGPLAGAADTRVREHVVAQSRAVHRVSDRQRDAAVVGELERVREEVLQHLTEPLLVRDDRPGEGRIDFDGERQRLLRGDVPFVDPLVTLTVPSEPMVIDAAPVGMVIAGVRGLPSAVTTFPLESTWNAPLRVYAVSPEGRVT